MAVAAESMTVEEFRNLPAIEGFQRELHHGEVVQMSRPKRRHDHRLYVLREILGRYARPLGYLLQEVAYRALPEFDLRSADLALVAKHRWNAVDDDDNLLGAPDFVVEVLSPSNNAEDIEDTRQLCLANGCREFWVVYPRLKQIEVSTASGSRRYRMGETIESAVFAQTFAVADLLADTDEP